MKHARITALTDDAAAISALSAETDSAKVSLEDLERSMGGAFSIQSGQTVSLPCPITQLPTNYRPIDPFRIVHTQSRRHRAVRRSASSRSGARLER